MSRWKGQPGWAVTSSVRQDIAPHLQLELCRESIHKTLQELAIAWEPDIIPVWLCLPFNINTVISSLPFMPVVSPLMDKWQCTTVELVLPHFFSWFKSSALRCELQELEDNCPLEIWLYRPCSGFYPCNWLISMFEGEYRIVWKMQKQRGFRCMTGKFFSVPSLHHSLQEYLRPVHSRLLLAFL